jgi:hypothetical protein
LDHGILLQSNRKWKKALKEHEAVERLLNGTPDPGIRGFNAFKAATAATELGQDDVAVEWLQQALELEPSLREQIRGEPTLRRLRSHPDAANFS